MRYRRLHNKNGQLTRRDVNGFEHLAVQELSPNGKSRMIAEARVPEGAEIEDVPFTPPTAEQVKAHQISIINADADAQVHEIADAEAQNYMLARGLELKDIEDERSLTEDEVAEKEALKSKWAAIKLIRQTQKETIEAL